MKTILQKNLCVVACCPDTYSGYGARSRDFCKALIEVKGEEWDIKIHSLPWGNTPTGFIKNETEWTFLEAYILRENLTKAPDYFFQITVPNEFQRAGRYNIGVTAGIETTLAAGEWIQGVNRMDRVLVSSNHAKETFLNTKFDQVDQFNNPMGTLKIDKPIDVLFEGINLDIYKYLPKEERDVNICDLNTITESFCFLTVGHWLPGDFGQDRKNIGYTIKTFFEVFKNKKVAPALILKTSVNGGSSILSREEVLKRIDSIRRSVKASILPNVYLLNAELSDEEMNQVYNHPKVKVMISLTKGEGFGRPLLEFTQTKKPIIASAWSGHLDFLNEHSVLVHGSLTNVHPSAANNMILKEAQWFTPDDAEVAKAYNYVYTSYSKALESAKRLAYKCKNNFSYENMKEELSKYISELPVFEQEVKLQLPELKL